MTTLTSQISSLAIVYSIDYSDADQRKHQRSASLAFVRGIHRGPMNSPHKWPVTRKMFPFDDVIMQIGRGVSGDASQFYFSNVHTHIRLGYINPLHAKFFRRNKNIHLHFMPFPHMNMTQLVGILPRVRQGLTYPT